MIRAVLRWLISSLVLLFSVTALTFVLAFLAPGNAAKAVLAGQTNYTPHQYQQVRDELGINHPLPVQYWDWLVRLLHGNLGTDLFNGQSIAQALNGRLAASLSIIVGTVLVAGVLGISIGIGSALRGGVIGQALDVVAALGFAVPNFWLALVLVELFSVKLRVFPTTGYVPFSSDPLQWAGSLALPVITLSIGATAFIARQTRDSMRQVLARDFITALRAHGIPLRSIVFKHALRNAAIPVVTVLGVLFVGLLGGTVFVEQIFAIPGLGQQAVTASSSHDLPMIEGIAFYFAVIVIAINLLVDLSYRKLNPKVDAK
ncbi:MAG: ABC transporter permease [Acidimicrobiales bacterium]